MSKKNDKKKYYAVARGHKPGVYRQWFGADGAKEQIDGFPRARYKGFPTEQEAQDWLEEIKNGGDDAASKSVGNGAGKSAGKTKTLKDIDVKTELESGKVMMYTDGGALNNPGPGGYGVVMYFGEKRKELSGGFRNTTNNRMELSACIAGLNSLKRPCSVILVSDSKYVVDGIEKGWARRWKSKGWMRNAVSPAENYDLWGQLLELTETHDVEFTWVKGHAGHPENERCDQLAKEFAGSADNTEPDINFEEGRTTISAAK